MSEKWHTCPNLYRFRCHRHEQWINPLVDLKTSSTCYHLHLYVKATLKEKKNGKTLEKSGNFVSPRKYEPCLSNALKMKAVHNRARVATAQGKQGIWLLTFPDRENTGNLVNLIFYTGKIVATQGKF